MKKTLLAALLAALMLVCTGCASFLERDYSVVQPHRAVSVAMTPVITVLMCSAELFSMGHLRFFALAFPGLHQKPFVHKISPLLFGMDAEF